MAVNWIRLKNRSVLRSKIAWTETARYSFVFGLLPFIVLTTILACLFEWLEEKTVDLTELMQAVGQRVHRKANWWKR